VTGHLWRRTLQPLTAGLVALGLVCTGYATGNTSASSSAASSHANLNALRSVIKRYEKVPRFSAPGPAFKASKARGKKVLMLSLSDSDPFNVIIEGAMRSALAKDGVKATDYADTGLHTQWVQGMNTAISEKVGLVALIGIDPTQLAPQIKAAQNAGIKVIDGQFVDVHHAYPAPFKSMARVPSPYRLAGQLTAAWAILQTKGKANIIIVDSNDIPSSRDEVGGMQSELKKYCPACRSTAVDVPFSDWATTGQTTVRSALVKDPHANYVIPVFDSMMSFVGPAIKSGSSTSVKVATYNGSPAELKMLQSHDLVTMDLGEAYNWTGWLFADQALRALTGVKRDPTSRTVSPVRIWTSANARQTGVPPTATKGYGTAYIKGFLRLWGLH
jgi:ribose transport system substrate-binding protein